MLNTLAILCALLVIFAAPFLLVFLAYRRHFSDLPSIGELATDETPPTQDYFATNRGWTLVEEEPKRTNVRHKAAAKRKAAAAKRKEEHAAFVLECDYRNALNLPHMPGY